MNHQPSAPYVLSGNERFRLTYMVDCARNAVPTVETLEKLIDLLKVLGYDALMLYLEDCFEVTGEPYFGYLRGRYSKDELKHIDAYGITHGIEVVPAIQTLAHLNQAKRWYEYQGVFDIEDILEVGSPRANLLLENMFKTLAECFTFRRVNVGMDEAHLLGRGAYFDHHGNVPHKKIIAEQMDFVHGLCERYGFKPMMWSDMFFRLSYGDYFQIKDFPFPQEVKDLNRGRFQMVYWDYYHGEVAHYEKMFDCHAQLGSDTVFAGGLWKWSGFTPDNRAGIGTLTAGLTAALKKGIKDVIVTGWGDNGGETSLFAVLPGLVFAGAVKYGKEDMMTLDMTLRLVSGLGLFDFMRIDNANRGFRKDNPAATNTTNKSLLFNDPLLGIMDPLATFIDPLNYHHYAEELKSPVYEASPFYYLFQTQKALLEVLELKATLGLELRKAYHAKDMKELKQLSDKIDVIIGRLDVFHSLFKAQWFKENKPHGFDVQDRRLGGLKARLVTTQEKMKDFIDGRTSSISELDEKLLDQRGFGEVYQDDPFSLEHRLRRVATVNVDD